MPITTLIKDIEPLLNSQAVTSDSIRKWAANLKTLSVQTARPTRRSATSWPRGAPAMGQVNALFQQMQPTLPILLANLVSLGKVGVTYNPSLEQILVVLPQGGGAGTIAVPNMDGTDRGFLSFTSTSTRHHRAPPASCPHRSAATARPWTHRPAPTRTCTAPSRRTHRSPSVVPVTCHAWTNLESGRRRSPCAMQERRAISPARQQSVDRQSHSHDGQSAAERRDRPVVVEVGRESICGNPMIRHRPGADP